MKTRPRRPTSARTPRHPLSGRVAVVAGATRGAGRGIARALGEAGAMVYCTGRSMRDQPSPYNRPETVDQTADMIVLAGGSAVAVRVDHTIEAEVEALFSRVDREHGHLDVLVNSLAGEDPLMGQRGWFWTTDLANGEAGLRQGLLSHIITAKHAAAMMIRRKRGLIVEVTETHILGGGGNPVSQCVKLALKGMAMNMATELAPHGVAAIAITPGFLRSESMLERFGVTEQTWRDGGKKDANFLESESPLFVGRAVAALAARCAHHGADRAAPQLLGSRARVSADRCRRPPAGLGRPRHRFFADARVVRRLLPYRHQDSAGMAGTGESAHEAVRRAAAAGEISRTDASTQGPCWISAAAPKGPADLRCACSRARTYMAAAGRSTTGS